MRSPRRAPRAPQTAPSATATGKVCLVPLLALTGLLVAGSATLHNRPEPAPAAATKSLDAVANTRSTAGLLLVKSPPRQWHTVAPAPTPVEQAQQSAAGTEIAAPVRAVAGIPEQVLAAYRNAELTMAETQPGCGITWNLLAGIGRIESGHARSGDLDASGRTRTPIRGPALDGTLPGNEIIRAASGYVRAVGPMQFLPATWHAYASDGNNDGITDPDNVFDAALGAGRYLCSGGLRLSNTDEQLKAVLRYNNSMAYASEVLSWSSVYAGGSPTALPTEWARPDVTPSEAPRSPADNDVPESEAPDADATPEEQPAPAAPEPMIEIPGLPPIPCGIFCPPPPPPSGGTA